MCHNIGYSEMRLPNLMGHTGLAEVISKSAGWRHLVRTDCHPYARTFLCSLFAPVCLDTFIQPCRSLCVAVRESCAPALHCRGHTWPSSLDCDRFPADEDICLESLSKEYSILKAVKAKLSMKRTVFGLQEYKIDTQVEFLNQGLLLPYDTRSLVEQWLLVNENCTQQMIHSPQTTIYLIVGTMEESHVYVNQIYHWQRKEYQLNLALKSWLPSVTQPNSDPAMMQVFLGMYLLSALITEVRDIHCHITLPVVTQNQYKCFAPEAEQVFQTRSTGIALECEVCKGVGHDCTGHIETCPPGYDSCAITAFESEQVPPLDTKLNGLQCPGCYGLLPDSCDDDDDTVNCTGSDPICHIEVPKRLISCLEHLKRYNLAERCISVPAREGTEDEIISDYLEIVKSTQKMDEGELRKVSANYDAVYFHPTTYRCAKLAVGAALELVDTVMSGKARNGMALVRPPGHHSQRNAANGFCIFNNVAIAAKYAQRKYGLQRTLIVDWDVHHGQGIQYIFDEDPSVLYFSWHRYEHQQFWPLLRESNYDAVGQGKGRGFNINVPWNQFDPELVLVSAGYDSAIGDPEGGYHLRSLSESVCMTIKTLLGDSLPRLSGEMAPCLSAIESIQNVRAVHKHYWKCLMYEDTTPLQFLSTRSHQMGEAERLQTGPQLVTQQEAEAANRDEPLKTERFLDLHMKEITSSGAPVKTAGAVAESESHLLPPSVQIERKTDTRELKAIISEFAPELLTEGNVLNSLANMLAVLDKIVRKEVTNGLAVSPMASLSSTIALRRCSNLGLQKVLCVFVGDLDMKMDLDDGKVLLINICAKEPEQENTKYKISLKWKEDVGTNSHLSAIFGVILPVAYSYQPDLTVLVIRPNQNLSKDGISLLISLLQGLGESRMLVLIQDTETELLQDITKPLTGDYIPSFGTCAPASKESMQMLKELREEFQEDWKMLQCSGK
ncbi:hypothetical protein lerEdw1_000717 [Lerista edwardsae]|nr:hypothetical protein lerEdw1_000717 [Lerista edwardsae]